MQATGTGGKALILTEALDIVPAIPRQSFQGLPVDGQDSYSHTEVGPHYPWLVLAISLQFVCSSHSVLTF